MKKLLLFLVCTCALLNAKVINEVAAVVEDDAITTAEIVAVKKQVGVSKEKALELLIQDRLQSHAMKNIHIPEEEIDQKIEEIAKQNRLTLPKMQKILKQQGTSWVQYRKGIRDALKKARFFQTVVAPLVPEPSEDELKLFYSKNKSHFMIPKRITLMEYTHTSKKVLEQFMRTHKKQGVFTQKIHKLTKDLSPELLSTFLQTPTNKYTPVMNTGEKYIVYKVISTQGKYTMPFDLAKTAVLGQWKQMQQEEALKDYFEKLRTRADIQILQ